MATFHDHLIINRWLLGLFNQESLKAFKNRLGDDRLTGIGESGQTRFFEELDTALFHSDFVLPTDLRRYDLNVSRHWQAITESRNRKEGHELEMKYFQYLSLLFTEIYLDWFFNKKEELAAALNRTLQGYLKEEQARRLSAYEAADLNKIAYWNATGSGKTLLMHINILQYRDYCQSKTDKVIVLTPNEGLSRQHVQELADSGFHAALFDKNSGGLFADEIIVIDVNKLADKNGDKTVAAEAFAGNNLVLVDEGHRGTSGDAWLLRRETLIGPGFAFEYSATFGQAVAKGKTVAEQEEELQKKKAKMLFGKGSLKGLDDGGFAQLELTDTEKKKARQTAVFETYAKAVLFDYSYKFFYEDGYGKESLILNLKDEDYGIHGNVYLTACLLAFYQQLYLFETQKDALAEWNIEKPLWVFVGNKVADDDSDVLKVLKFLAFFLNNREQVQIWLADLLSDKARLTDKNGNNIFGQRFVPLMDFAGKENELYADILQRFFHAPNTGRLNLTHLKKSDGEIALRAGGGEVFGIINIGDAAGFMKTAEKDGAFDCSHDDFSDGLFGKINQKDSPTHLLIGSKKFTEGWSSWRVSTMGLLNMGKSEGSQIIQLFGRGVRLKGRGFSLRRSLPEERPYGAHLDKLETLNIFGIAAGYMEQFKNYLKEEGITPPDEMLTVDFKVLPNLPDGVTLQTLRLKNGYKDNQKLGFKRQKTVDLYDIPDEWAGKIKPPCAFLNRYPQIEAMDSGRKISAPENRREKNRLDSRLFDLFDWDRIYRELSMFKSKRTWSNLRLDKGRLKAFAEGNDWYVLEIPASALAVNRFADVKKQEDLLIELLCLYTESFYGRLKSVYEGQFYETAAVDAENGSMLDGYRFDMLPDSTGKSYEAKLLELKTLVETGRLKELLAWKAPGIAAISFSGHLYYPIMSLDKKSAVPVKMQPLPMNEESEVRFVQDLQAACDEGRLKEWTLGRDLYLLRNASNKAKGLGFALAGNFYPDFLLWLVDRESGRQWLTFIDPKGIRHMTWEHPKFGLADEVKKLEQSLKLQDLTLNSFILSVTPYKGLLDDGVAAVFDKTEDEFRKKHILFMEDENYLQTMFDMILNGDKV